MNSVRHFLDAIKFEHTVFALPFAYVAMVLAANGWPDVRIVGWVTLAMVSGRTLAMAVNRLADRWFDARKPRTRGGKCPPASSIPPGHGGGGGRGRGVPPLGMDAEPAVSRARAGGHVPGRLLLHKALHLALALDPGSPTAPRGAGGWIAVRGLRSPVFVLWFALTVWIAGFA